MWNNYNKFLIYIKLSVPSILCFICYDSVIVFICTMPQSGVSHGISKSVIKISPSKFMVLLMGESSCRAATLLHLDLHDNFLGYHLSEETSSLLLLSSICLSVFYTYCQVAAVPSIWYRHCLISLSQMEFLPPPHALPYVLDSITNYNASVSVEVFAYDPG